MSAVIKSTLTNAADISVFPVRDETNKTGGGPQSVGGMCVVASKGWPFRIIECRADDWEAKFGKVLAPSANGYEGLRHLRDAVDDCEWVDVVRVVDSAAKFPEITVRAIDDKGAWASGATYQVGDVVTVTGAVKLICLTADTTATVEPTAASADWDAFTSPAATNALAYQTNSTGTVPGDGYAFTIWPADGDPSTTRRVEIASALNYLSAWAVDTDYEKGDVLTVTGGYLYCLTDHTSPESGSAPTLATPGPYWRALTDQDKRLVFTFYNTTALGEEYVEDTLTVGVSESDKDDMGASAFIESVFESQSDFRAIWNPDVTWDDIQDALAVMPASITFTGGTNGGNPTSSDWINAVGLFENDPYVRHLAAAGNYDSAYLAACVTVADNLHITFSCDVSPSLTPDEAMAELKSWGIRSRQAQAYYSPYSRYCPTFERQVVWGVSGSVLAAWAKGEANFTGNVPGVHYSPAGQRRGYVWGTKATALHPDKVINKDKFYDVRLNPILPGDSGGIYISDSMSLHYEENHSRFCWVSNILNYIVHRFVQGAREVQHEPDGITRPRLDRMIRTILDDLVTSGALVPARDENSDGKPYSYKVTQIEIDYWHVEWAVCPTGSARRIAGQPVLIR